MIAGQLTENVEKEDVTDKIVNSATINPVYPVSIGLVVVACVAGIALTVVKVYSPMKSKQWGPALFLISCDIDSLHRYHCYMGLESQFFFFSSR